MKLLDGRELAGYIQERQAQQVRALRQAWHVFPKLAVVRTQHDNVSDSYLKQKLGYAADTLIDVEVHTVVAAKLTEKIQELNADASVHGIIIEIPLPDPLQTDEALNAVLPEKDVDGLGQQAIYDPATPVAINWLLAGYNVELRGKHIVIVGQGRLVGKPLAGMWRASELDVEVADKFTEDLKGMVQTADVLVTATGVPGLITADMVKPSIVIVDAGVSSNEDGLVGDVAPDVRELPDITITPEKGGVGPLTVCALFDNLLRAARATTEGREQ